MNKAKLTVISVPVTHAQFDAIDRAAREACVSKAIIFRAGVSSWFEAHAPSLSRPFNAGELCKAIKSRVGSIFSVRKPHDKCIEEMERQLREVRPVVLPINIDPYFTEFKG